MEDETCERCGTDVGTMLFGFTRGRCDYRLCESCCLAVENVIKAFVEKGGDDAQV